MSIYRWPRGNHDESPMSTMSALRYPFSAQEIQPHMDSASRRI
jgi:hypothetical protein